MYQLEARSVEIALTLLAEIVGVIPDAKPIYDTAHERRMHLRMACGTRARIAPLFDSVDTRGLAVLLSDISQTGVGFYAPGPMAVGDEFALHLPRNDGQGIVQIHSMVTRCERGGVGLTKYAVAATFEQVLNTHLVPTDNVINEVPAIEPEQADSSPETPDATSPAEIAPAWGKKISRRLQNRRTMQDRLRSAVRPLNLIAGFISRVIGATKSQPHPMRAVEPDIRPPEIIVAMTTFTGENYPFVDEQHRAEARKRLFAPRAQPVVPSEDGVAEVPTASPAMLVVPEVIAPLSTNSPTPETITPESQEPPVEPADPTVEFQLVQAPTSHNPTTEIRTDAILLSEPMPKTEPKRTLPQPSTRAHAARPTYAVRTSILIHRRQRRSMRKSS